MTANRKANLTLVIIALFSATPLAAQDFCDPSLPKLVDNPQGYRMRAGRCEGIYAQELAAAILRIASLTESFEDFDPGSGNVLNLEWDRPRCGAEVRVRAQGLRRRLYYRMDTMRPASARSYEWPVGILAAQDLHRNDIGVLAWTLCPGIAEELFMPVRVRQKENLRSSSGLQLIIIPGMELKEVYVTLAQTDKEGRVTGILEKERAVGYGYYPSEQKIEIPIAGVKMPGLYRLELAARLRSGGISTTELWFYRGKE